MPVIEKTQLGSKSALSLITETSDATKVHTPPLTIPFPQKKYIYKKLEKPVNQLHLEKIDKIVKLYTKHLTNIPVSNSTILISFPPIFKINADKTISYLTLADKQKTMEENNWLSLNEMNLSNYMTHIFNAISKLHIQNYQNNDKKMIEELMNQYLVHLFHVNLIHFQAKPVDIAYMQALKLFVDKYSTEVTNLSIANSIHDACQELDEIYQADKEAKMIMQLFRTIRNYSEKLLIGLVHLVTPSEDWVYIVNANPTHLMEGKYLISENDGELKFKSLPDSFITSWIKVLASYQIQSLQTCFSQLNVASLDKIHLTHELPQEGINVIREIFNKCKNLFTLKLVSSPNSIDKDSDVKEPLQLCVEWVLLIDIMNAYLLFLTQFSIKHKNLKEFKKNNPYYCSQLYIIHEGLSTSLKKHVDNLAIKFNTIKKNFSSVNIQNMEQEKAIFENMLSYLQEISKLIDENKNQISELKNAFANFSTEQATEVKDEMIIRLLWLEYRYHFMANANQEDNKDVIKTNKLTIQDDSKSNSRNKINKRKGRIFLHRNYDPVKLSQWENIPIEYNILKIKKIFIDFIKPYKTNTHLIKDFIQPIVGLRNVFIGIYNISLGLFPLNKSQLALGPICVLRGIIEIALTPFTWLVKIPMRMLISAIQGKPKIEMNAGIKKLAKLGQDKLNNMQKLENGQDPKWNEVFIICSDIHRKFKKSQENGQESFLVVPEKENFTKISKKPNETRQLIAKYFSLFVENENENENENDTPLATQKMRF